MARDPVRYADINDLNLKLRARWNEEDRQKNLARHLSSQFENPNIDRSKGIEEARSGLDRYTEGLKAARATPVLSNAGEGPHWGRY